MSSDTVTDAILVSQAAAKLTGKDKRIVRKSTAVIHPKTALLKPPIHNKKRSLTQWNNRWERHVIHDVKKWKVNVPTYKLKGVTLEDLQVRKKNNASAKGKAQLTMEMMKSWESDGASGIFKDENGNTLLAYFARRHEMVKCSQAEGSVFYEPGPNTPSAMGRSAADLDQAEDDEETVYFDGIKKDLLDKVLVSTQLLVHRIGIGKSHRDGRHDQGDTLMQYMKEGCPSEDTGILAGDHKSFMLNNTEYIYQDHSFTSESTGVLHLVHAWPDQGHNAHVHGIHPSSNMVPGGLLLAEMFQASFPEFYYKYEAAFKAGRWTVDDPGPFLGRAIVWKLNVLVHQDGLDEGPAVIFPMGNFNGGECYIPDLKLKLSYRPGEVIILMAGALYHAIGEWAPLQGVSEHGITPGRVGNVWFFPHASYEVLKDKPVNWSLNTAGGLRVSTV